MKSLKGLRVSKSTLCIGFVAVLGVRIKIYILCCPACWQRTCNVKPPRDQPWVRGEHSMLGNFCVPRAVDKLLLLLGLGCRLQGACGRRLQGPCKLHAYVRQKQYLAGVSPVSRNLTCSVKL